MAKKSKEKYSTTKARKPSARTMRGKQTGGSPRKKRAK